jgi:lipid kinase YegS
MNITVIIRPPADRERIERLRTAIGGLRGVGHEVHPLVTFEAGDATRFARRAAAAHHDLVIAAGGDGTINEVVNGIARAKWQPRLGLVKFGTANDFATGIGVPSEPEAAVRVAVEGRIDLIDVARVNRRCFVNVSTGGFGAEATEEAAPEVKRRFGPLAYVMSGAKKLVELRPARARFRADGELVHDGDYVFFAVGNARLTGGGTRIAPRAEVSDGKLDVVLVAGVSRIDFLTLLPDLRAGTHIESPDVLYFRAHRFDVEAPEPIAVNADGEPLRARRYRYVVMDRPLQLMVPPDTE